MKYYGMSYNKKIIISGRQKKKFRRIVNKSIKSRETPEPINLPKHSAKILQDQVNKAYIFKGRHFI